MQLVTSLTLVDELGLIKAKIAELTAQETAIKNQLIAGGEADFDGALFRATVRRQERQFIDSDLARKVLDEKTLAKITKTSSTYVVRVAARKAA